MIYAAAATALISTYAAGWVVRTLWADRVVDHPGPRRSHVQPTTRLGGIAVAAGLLAGTVAGAPPTRVAWGLVAAAGVAGVVGLAEDVRELPVVARLAGQALAGAAGGLLLASGPLGWVGAALGIVAFANVFNFMDGINGLSASQLAVAGAAWLVAGAVEEITVVQVLGAVSVGCAAGYLPHNFPTAKVFMGDLGSYAAGAWLAAGVVVGWRAGIAPVAVVAPLALHAFDVAWTLAARARRGENLLEAHRSHLYQRLVAAGWTHARTTLVSTGVSASIAAAGLMALLGGWLANGAAAGLAAGMLAGYAFFVSRRPSL